MDGIEHRTVSVNGINMHLAEKGAGPTVLLLHGFPQLWYTWRHQIHGLAARGYRAVAPDLRGFGDTDAPPSSASYTVYHIVGDLIALIDLLGQDQVFVVGHDWGAIMAWYLCLFRPDRIKALVNLSVNFMRRPPVKTVDALHSVHGENHYMCRFQEPGAAESDFACVGAEKIFKIAFTYRHSGPLIVPKDGFVAWPDKELNLPSWISEADVRYYAEKFNKTGFTGGLNYYRALNLNWELTAPWDGFQVQVPTKFIVGDLDLTYHTLGAKEYIHSDEFKKDVPFLEDVIVMEGVAHFINEEKPDEITDHIFSFFQKFN
ncbi:uncharacterized protein LOC131231778 isoform X1 [Magnolia sinica]|uniref:uncharacterized protein LOC131231778 isoform X1 n=1 Tax=Magnolia sinica TaxID=86752 RepID=UPI002658E9A4|nr:uncharacterized protein LOC131231778 isoform X1 [Magnolia sinica]